MFSAAHPRCQGNTDFPAFYQGSVKQYSLDDGLPDNCVWDRLIDKHGRLWLVNCPSVQIQQGLHLYQFDGYRAHSVDINLSDQANESVYHIAGIDRAERIYGFALNLTTFFFFQPYDGSVHEYKLEGTGSSASGWKSLWSNTTGSNNTASGGQALFNNTTGSHNTALGYLADVTYDSLTNATAIGYNAKVATSNSLVLGGTDSLAVNVGIGTTSPDTPLHVMGSIKMEDGSHAAGNVMISDSDGVASWTSQSTLSPIMLVDADGDTKIHVEETADEDIIRFDMAGTERWIMTGARLEPMNSGQSVFIGEGAGANDELNQRRNVFVGYQAGNTNTTGFWNTASGFQALFSNTTGFGNTPSGYQALYSNTTGTGNTASGYRALYSNTAGNSNTASGYQALNINTTGNFNTATGRSALIDNTIGVNNTASGFQALLSNTTGNSNTASGMNALRDNTTGINNTAIGRNALLANTTGSNNTALGFLADVEFDSLTNATAIGYNAKVATSNSLVLGGTGGFAVNVGIGTTSPSATLDVVGTVKLGAAGTSLTSIIKTTVNVDLPNISSDGVLHQSMTVTGASVGATVFVSPADQLDGSVFIGYARVVSADTVEVTFLNEGSNGQDMAAMDFYITVIQ